VPSKQTLIEAIIDAAKHGRFARNKLGERPTTFENLQTELLQCDEQTAQAVRARLSRLSKAQLMCLLHEWVYAADKYYEREKLREKQRELGRRPRSRSSIAKIARQSAASDYRARNMRAKDAWDAIKERPYQTDTEIVRIEGCGNNETMRVRSRDDETPIGRAIRFNRWQDYEWPLARQRGSH
jgi:hypothetical protein